MPLGYIITLIASIFLSLYIVPKKLSKQEPLPYTMFVGLGFLVISLISFFVHGFAKGEFDNLFHPAMFFAALNGIDWMLGSFLFVTAIDRIGLSRSNQWKNLQGPIGAILSLLILGEWAQTNVIFVLMAVVTIFISACLFTIRKSEEKRIDKKSIYLAIMAATLFGVNALLQKLVINLGGGAQAQQLYISAFIFLTGVVLVLYQQRNLKFSLKINQRDNYLGIISGVIYFFASFLSIIANHQIPGSITFTIIQFNAVWTILIGVLIFKEINWKKHWLRLLIGIFFAILSIWLLLLARKI